MLWVEKYKPQSFSDLAGQQGAKSNARKLLRWLTEWHENRVASGIKQNFWANKFSDSGSVFKAALLSGPPGVGKTTTAEVICKQAGFSTVELNASDDRSKKSLQGRMADALQSYTLAHFSAQSKVKFDDRRHHCIIMEEVDGMAGNEDRGGVQELIGLIKQTKVPIICTCNDRNHQKVRALVNYCFDLRFSKMRLDQVRPVALSICRKESVNISTESLDDIIASSNQDLRQVIHQMQLWSSTQKGLQKAGAKKEYSRSTFDACSDVFSSRTKSIGAKTELFFEDYNIMPLFVQENYVLVKPSSKKLSKTKDHMRLLSLASDAISEGDIVSDQIGSSGSWGLLPTQAVFSTVAPGYYLDGHLAGRLEFPQWLGKFSKSSRVSRLVQELLHHMALKVKADGSEFVMEYLPILMDVLVRPLRSADSVNVDSVVDTLDSYNLNREDLNSILELSLWPGGADVMSTVPTKVKSALTRAYNKRSHLEPYALSVTAPKRAKTSSGEADGVEDLLMNENDEDVESTQESQPDPMVSKRDASKKPTTSRKAGATKVTAGSSSSKVATGTRGRGRKKK